MSQDDHSPKPGASADSQDASPTETRATPRRFAPITHDEDEEGHTTTGTVRRNRPPSISVNTGTNYGMLIFYRNRTNLLTNDCLGSGEPYNTTEEQPSDGLQTPTPHGRGHQGIRGSETSSRQVLSPEPLPSAPKPKMPRRTSSKYPAPHKGQGFSVDDDPSEYESDHARRHASSAKSVTGSAHALRRQSSTLRRRTTAQPTALPRVDSQGEEEAEAEQAQESAALPEEPEEVQDSSGEDGTVRPDMDEDNEEDDDGLSDAESFTLKDRQNAINETHPFGIRIWKPALYQKNRSIERTAEGDIHSSPGGRVSRWLWMFNIVWTVLFGWWLALAAALGAVTCFAFGFTPAATDYGRVFWGLSLYLFYPFGQFVKLEQDEAYAEEDEGEGRSITEYEQWQNGDLEDGRLFFGPLTSRSLIGRRRSLDSADENDSLLGRPRRGANDSDGTTNRRARLFGRGQWTVGRVIFFVFFYFWLAPLMVLASGICWFMVFWIPMGKVTMLLLYHLRRHPLALSFNAETAYSRQGASSSSSVLVCTYRAVGLKYWKYTLDGTNIFLINLIAVVLFAIFDYWVLAVALGIHNWITNPGFVFLISLFSIIPLAYFIGQAVASISAQSSMGVGAAVNAFFSTIVEVFLYCVALNQGKGQLVEGSIIGSIFAGILFLPGISMCCGAIKRKTQRFNVKSAGVTSTMLLFATIAAFGPTLFYQIYGSHELTCHSCIVVGGHPDGPDEDCRRCYYSQVPAINDRFFLQAVRPYCWVAAVLLFLSYMIGLWFTLRTHAATIWNVEMEEKNALAQSGINGSIHQPTQGPQVVPKGHGGSNSSKDSIGRHASGDIRDTQLYKRLLDQTLKQQGIGATDSRQVSTSSKVPPQGQPPYLVPPKSSDGDNTFNANDSSQRSGQVSGLFEEENNNLVRQVAEMAATAAAVATRDATKNPRKTSISAMTINQRTPRATAQPTAAFNEDHEIAADGHASGGHDAPNWGRAKSSLVLLGATILYAIIAEILVDTVDVVLASVDIDEKFLGIILFALVPNITEFLNAISFAMNGNIALSMEIGSAYALQVFLLQIPALVLFSALHGRYIDPEDLVSHTFNLIFPQWDMVTVILCIFLLSYVYGEGKSNYFKGSILLLTYIVIIMGFYLAGYSNDVELMGIDRFDTLALGQKSSFKTVGRMDSGKAFS